MKTPTWRLIQHGPEDGYTNMAIDEAMMLAQVADHLPPTLRLFLWQPACISLGYFQNAEAAVDRDGCRRLGIGCVRRPTGGRAILHDRELTYSVVAPVTNPLVSGSVVESYRKISLALLAGLAELGVQAQMKQLGHSIDPGAGSAGASAPRELTAACFDVPSDYEITVGGRKLIGSAQTRRGGVLLQHGSLLLEVDALRTFTALRPPPGVDRGVAAQWLAQRVTSLADVLRAPVATGEIAIALERGFSKAFAVAFEHAELTGLEQESAQRLRAEKYATDEWNWKADSTGD